MAVTILKRYDGFMTAITHLDAARDDRFWPRLCEISASSKSVEISDDVSTKEAREVVIGLHIVNCIELHVERCPSFPIMRRLFTQPRPEAEVARWLITKDPSDRF